MSCSSAIGGAPQTADFAIVDTGPLYAAVDASDANHDRAVATLRDPTLRLVVPAMVVAEATYLIGVRLGPRIEAGFLRGLADFDVRAPAGPDWRTIAELVKRYGDFPLGGTDASVISLAERVETDLVISFDHRHFSVVRPRDGRVLQLLPG